MSDKEIPKFISDRVDQICKENGFCDYFVDINPGAKVGDNFSGDIISIKIVERNTEKELILVCKIAPLNKNRRQDFHSDSIFKREILFYNKLMPLFAKFQEEKGLSKDDQFLAYPKCYGTVCDDEKEEYAVFLEDLRPQNYKMWNKAKPSPIENVRFAMREIGKFHGISFAMKDQRPNEFAEFKEVPDVLQYFVESENSSKLFSTSYTYAVQSLSNEHYKNIYRDVEQNFVQYFHGVMNEKGAGAFGVVCHGDFWNNNLLFRFNENDNTAEDIRLLDWQLLRYTSPAIDLLYNIFTSTDKALRDEEYDNILQLYYSTLSKTIKLLGSNPNELFTFDDLQNELKRCGNHALLMAAMILQVTQADSEEITNLDEVADKNAEGETPQDLNFVNGLSNSGQREFERRLSGVIEDILQFGYYTTKLNKNAK